MESRDLGPRAVKPMRYGLREGMKGVRSRLGTGLLRFKAAWLPFMRRLTRDHESLAIGEGEDLWAGICALREASTKRDRNRTCGK